MIDYSKREQQLRRLMDETANFLDRFGESFWASKLRSAAAKAKLDSREVASWYGGMGSFNDLLISRVNGHRIDVEDEGGTNEQLSRLRSRIYQLSENLRR